MSELNVIKLQILRTLTVIETLILSNCNLLKILPNTTYITQKHIRFELNRYESR